MVVTWIYKVRFFLPILERNFFMSRFPQEEYDQLIEPYKEAMNRMQMRINGLNEDYRKKYRDYPIHNIQTRIKSRKSLEKKLIARGFHVSPKSAAENITDIAGIRIICYFKEDIFGILTLIKEQQDLVIIKESDYITNPKPSGYKSYHMVVGVPVYRIDGMKHIPVEIQFRTLAMDLWASMEHRICYKNDFPEETAIAFQKYSQALTDMEQDMKIHLDEIRKQDPQEPTQ